MCPNPRAPGLRERATHTSWKQQYHLACLVTLCVPCCFKCQVRTLYGGHGKPRQRILAEAPQLWSKAISPF